MHIQTKVEPADQEEKTYPYLGIDDNGQVVCFVRKGAGSILSPGLTAPSSMIGCSSTVFNEEEFSPFYGTLTIVSSRDNPGVLEALPELRAP